MVHMSYENLIEDLIAAQADILGAQAIEVARGVRGLQIDDDGTVLDITEDPVTIVDDLAGAYVADLGPAAMNMLTQVAEDYDDLDLPASLK